MLFAAFGVTGDLMKLKILPALCALSTQGKLPAQLSIVGISRRAWDDAQLRDYIQRTVPNADAGFLERFTFVQGDADSLETFQRLKQLAANADLLLYLALAPTLYRSAITNMHEAGFSSREALTRVLLEKPFGISGENASLLYTLLERVVPAENIYLVDHYLSKEWVRDLASLPVPLDDIAQLQLRFLETTGVETRGNVYDQLGALRDVVQNHLLQMLAQIVAPTLRSEALERLPVLTSGQVASHTSRAQYGEYLAIAGVAATSDTETYCKLTTSIGVSGWEHVTVVFEAGKRRAENCKEAMFVLRDGSTVTIAERQNTVPEYETLLLAAVAGDHSFFPSMREIRAQWRFIDPILSAWSQGDPPMEPY